MDQTDRRQVLHVAGQGGAAYPGGRSVPAREFRSLRILQVEVELLHKPTSKRAPDYVRRELAHEADLPVDPNLEAEIERRIAQARS